ncbi:hypothetical protein CAS74_001246 [Pichia kudriavzevii]|uniref:Homeobox domain-containing protein n=1 Tax=Pichia kudriavzevii TaxID=4909 RepID=A0A1Z8JQT2_PICKU|nr:uncharacterized protein C5L36_0A00560 [Pichia kudriavzevii]AWU73444.1 hypothetical protein C5L36_0A00560 [Pichia kudriavzevii]OUT22945.1 hypothetical protein CAS74_001246 [Pichia kudriavzevii]
MHAFQYPTTSSTVSPAPVPALAAPSSSSRTSLAHMGIGATPSSMSSMSSSPASSKSFSAIQSGPSNDLLKYSHSKRNSNSNLGMHSQPHLGIHQQPHLHSYASYPYSSYQSHTQLPPLQRLPSITSILSESPNRSGSVSSIESFLKSGATNTTINTNINTPVNINTAANAGTCINSNTNGLLGSSLDTLSNLATNSISSLTSSSSSSCISRPSPTGESSSLGLLHRNSLSNSHYLAMRPYQTDSRQRNISSPSLINYSSSSSSSSPSSLPSSVTPLSTLSSSGPKMKKKRSNLPKQATAVLLTWLVDNINHPYPNSKEKVELMRKTGLTPQQLSNWFINARRRKIQMLKEKSSSI